MMVLTNKYEDAFSDFTQRLTHPLRILDDSAIKEEFIEIFDYNSEGQLSLFGETKEDFNLILEEIINLHNQGKPLYERWNKNFNGKTRSLSVPKKPLRKFFDYYLLTFIKKYKVHNCCHGGEEIWSPKRSLESHLPCESMLSFDLKDAFASIGIVEIFNFFYETFDMYNYETRRDLAGFLAFLSTVPYESRNGRRGLPQGSPHSMALFNRILFSIDSLINEKSQERDLTYSRWVDDFSISSQISRNIEYFLGAIEFVQGLLPVAEHKIYFQRNQSGIYALGHIISGNVVLKNDEQDRLENKFSPINFSDYFGEARKLSYEPW